MVKRMQPDISSGVKCVLFFIMLAVFVWGLQTKLSHYRLSLHSSTSVDAKLLTDKSVEHSSGSFVEDLAIFTDDFSQRIEIPTIYTIHTVPFHQLALYQVELSLRSSSIYDSDGPNSMHLPPPAIS